MRKSICLAGVFFMVLFLFNCSDSNSVTDDPGADFDLRIEAIALPVNTIPFTVVYTASATGDGKVSKIDYYDENNESKTVTNPSLPWSKTVTITGGKNVYLYAKGNSSRGRVDVNCTATAGSLVITYAQYVARN